MRRGLALVGFAGIALVAGPTPAQEQKVASVGVAPITGEDPTPRDSALRAAVRTAVAEAAAAMLPAGFAAPTPAPATPASGEAEREPNAWLSERLGDPFAYVTRFRIVEDRGRRPAMFSTDRTAEFEYVVLAEVNLDLDAIRSKLEKLGMAASGGARGPTREVVLVVEGLTQYKPLALVQETLKRDRSVRSVRAVEFTTGRAVLAVDADADAAGLVASLTQRAPEGLAVTMIEQGAARATVRVDWQPPQPPAPPPTVAPPVAN